MKYNKLHINNEVDDLEHAEDVARSFENYKVYSIVLRSVIVV